MNGGKMKIKKKKTLNDQPQETNEGSWTPTTRNRIVLRELIMFRYGRGVEPSLEKQ